MFSLNFLKEQALLFLVSVNLFFFTKSYSREQEIVSEVSYNQHVPKKKWYGVFGTGYAFSMKSNIDYPGGTWDRAKEGYDSDVGGASFVSIGFGREFFDYFKFDTSYTFYLPFHYQKHQTAFGNTVVYTAPKRNRFFDLDHQSVLFNLYLHPQKNFYLSLVDLEISPYFGGGIGVGFSRIYNFNLVAYANQLGSIASLADKCTNSSLAWQACAGIRFHPVKSWYNLDISYRYYEGGKFYSSRNVYLNTPPYKGQSKDSTQWKGKLRTNQISLSFNMDF